MKIYLKIKITKKKMENQNYKESGEGPEKIERKMKKLTKISKLKKNPQK